MPVRIIFRGLILFRIEKEKTEEGRIVAQLIDHESAASTDPSMPGMQMANMPMSAVHRHQAEIQILSGAKGQSLVPVKLDRGVNLKMSPQGGAFVEAAPSYRTYVPKLSKIVNDIKDSNYRPKQGDRNPSFIRNTIIVDRGTIRTTELVSWDTGGYPLDGSPATGNAPRSPVDVRFMSSGFMASVAGECIIDIEKATSIDLKRLLNVDDEASVDSKSGDDALTGLWDAAPDGKRHNQHVAPDTVEILITNLPPQRERPIPWSVHYQWLFKAAGYEAAPFEYTELQNFREAAQAYAGKAFDVAADDLSLLEGENHDRGLPFPYLRMPVPTGRTLRDSMKMPQEVGSPMTDPWNRPLCPHGDE